METSPSNHQIQDEEKLKNEKNLKKSESQSFKIQRTFSFNKRETHKKLHSISHSQRELIFESNFEKSGLNQDEDEDEAKNRKFSLSELNQLERESAKFEKVLNKKGSECFIPVISKKDSSNNNKYNTVSKKITSFCFTGIRKDRFQFHHEEIDKTYRNLLEKSMARFKNNGLLLKADIDEEYDDEERNQMKRDPLLILKNFREAAENGVREREAFKIQIQRTEIVQNSKLKSDEMNANNDNNNDENKNETPHHHRHKHRQHKHHHHHDQEKTEKTKTNNQESKKSIKKTPQERGGGGVVVKKTRSRSKSFGERFKRTLHELSKPKRVTPKVVSIARKSETSVNSNRSNVTVFGLPQLDDDDDVWDEDDEVDKKIPLPTPPPSHKKKKSLDGLQMALLSNEDSLNRIPYIEEVYDRKK